MALMLIDTPDPRYRGEPDPEPDHEGWRPNLRVWIPIGASIVSFGVAALLSPFLMFVMTIVGLLLFFDGVLALVPSGDGLWSNRQ
jgi:hypothetical protein